MKRSEFSNINNSRERSDSITLLDRYHNSPELNKYFTDNVFLTEIWHGSDFYTGPDEDPIKSTWRSKERMKTTGVALVLCLNIGTDPPGIIKPYPCARKECWLDPFSQSKQKSLEMIGNALQMQYEKWQPKAKYKQCLDPSPDDLKRTCVNLRKATKGDRLLLHYNGHGVPMPTKNGELWVFFKNYTHYMPVSASELKSWLGEPAIYVFDCSGAGTLIPFFAEVAMEPPLFGGQDGYFLNPPPSTSGKNFSYQPPNLSQESPSIHPGSGAPIENSSIVLASCRRDEILPMNPQYPADLFSSCLTTPIAMAVRWLIVQNPYSMGEVSPEFVDNIPGKDGDRKSPRGELSWIFTTVTDTIAWSTLPLPTFQKLFRQDLLVASLFRNFLLAKRVMKSLNCTPQSWPPLPDSTTHHLWQAWDLAAESCVLAAYTSYKGTSMIDPRNNMSILPAFASSASTTFFSDHLTAFEVWLDFEASQSTLSLSTPTYLPVLLQMLLSPAHRLRALQLLRRYMSLGSHTVNLTLLVGIFPYVLKLLQNQSPDIRQVLLCIWTSIVGFDRSCRMELIRDKCQNYFVQYLLAKDLSSSHRCMAAFTLAEICNGTQEGRHSCFVLNLHSICCAIVASEDLTQLPDFKKWICLCLSKLFEDFAALKFKMLTELNSKMFIPFLLDAEPSVRAATVLMLSQLFGAFLHQSQSQPQSQQQQFQNASIGNFGNQPSVGINLSDPTVQEVVEEEVRLVLELLRSCTDGSVMVRREAIIALSKFIFQPFYKECFKMISRSIRKHMHPKRSIEGLSFLYTFGSGHPSHSFYGLYYQVYPWNLSNIDYDAVAEDLIIYFDEIGFTKTSALSAPVTARADVDANANDWTVGSAKSLTPFALATTDTRDIVVAAIYMLRSPSGESLSCADASSGVATPAVSSKHIDLQTKAPRVVDFLRIWFTLQEVFCSDPHPTVRASAAAVTKQISAEIDDEDMLLADSLRASSHDKSSSHQDLTNLPNQDVSSSFDSNLSADDARINILQQRSLMHKSSSDSVLTNKVANMYKLTHPMLAPQLGDNMSFRRSPSPLAPAPFASRPMPYGSGLNPSEGMAGIGNFGPNLNTGVISNNNSGSGGAGGGGQRSGGMMSSASPPIQPRQGSFCSYSVDGGGTDSSLVSFLYEWQCKLFLVPDCGFDPFDDPMSIEGQARIYRDTQMVSVESQCRRLTKTFQHLDEKHDYMLDKRAFSQFRPFQSGDDESLYIHGDRRRSTSPGDDLNQQTDIKFEQKLLITDKSTSKISLVMFHSFHDILASSDGDSISIWSLETSSRILNIPKKTNSHRGNVRSRPPSAPAFSTNQSNASLNGLYMSATADNQTGAATSATQLAGSYGQQNLSNPAGASGGRVGRSSPDIAPVVASTLAGTPSSTITTMSWINESYDALLLVGSDDGNVKIWRDTADSDVHASYTANVTGQGNFVSASRDTGAMGRSTGGNSGPSNGSSDAIGISLASSFTALPDIADTSSGSGLVTSWLQHSGTLVVGGNSSSIHVWDLSREQCVRTFSTGVDTCTTALTTLSSTPNYSLSYPMSHKYRAQGHNESNDSVPLTWTFAGFADGSIGVFDERVPVQGGRVHLSKEHESWIVSAHLRSDVPELITASIKGTVKFSDLRSMRTFKLLETQKSPLSAFAVHPAAPVFATGSQAQFIKVLTFQGDQLGSIIKYHDGFLGQRIGPVMNLAFHPFQLYLAGAADNIVSVYQGVTEPKL